MKLKTEYIITGLVAIFLLPAFFSSAGSYAIILQTFLPSVEGFSAVPIWDYKQWSWGYGTAAGYDRNNKPVGTISRDKAMQELLKTISENYRVIKPYVRVSLNPNQWAALLSLSYNLGATRAAQVFTPFINANDQPGLFSKMRQYVYAGGVKNAGLVNRREWEINLWNGVHEMGTRYRMADEWLFELRIAPELITDEQGN